METSSPLSICLSTVISTARISPSRDRPWCTRPRAGGITMCRFLSKDRARSWAKGTGAGIITLHTQRIRRAQSCRRSNENSPLPNRRHSTRRMRFLLDPASILPAGGGGKSLLRPSRLRLSPAQPRRLPGSRASEPLRLSWSIWIYLNLPMTGTYFVSLFCGFTGTANRNRVSARRWEISSGPLRA